MKHFFAITMQHSTLTRIIITFLMIVHMTQAYVLSVNLNFDSVCHVYVTDCHGTTLRNAGKKNCLQNDWHWPDAPDTYCLHIVPLTEGEDNRWCQGWKDDCMLVDGILDVWNIYRYPCNDISGCMNGSSGYECA